MHYFMTGEDGLLLKLDQDYFLCNKKSLLTHLTSSLTENTNSSSLKEINLPNMMKKNQVLLDISQLPHNILDSFPESIENCIQHIQHCLEGSTSDYIDIQGHIFILIFLDSSKNNRHFVFII